MRRQYGLTRVSLRQVCNWRQSRTANTPDTNTEMERMIGYDWQVKIAQLLDHWQFAMAGGVMSLTIVSYHHDQNSE